ncbi:hypothetical protein TNCT_170611, partial [Trichonephila clavata]
NKDAILG